MNMMKTILVVEDEYEIRELHRFNLEKGGFNVITTETGEEALSTLQKLIPDLILLDLMLPGMGGLECCRQLGEKKKLLSVPLIMVTALGTDKDIIKGLELGADDYITKPFSPAVLLARVNSLLRRGEKTAEDILMIQGLELDIPRHHLKVDGRSVELSATEFATLHLLMGNYGIVLSRGQIISSIKGDDYPVTERSVDVQILGLRRKLGAMGKQIETVRGIGYRLRETET